MDGLGGYAFNSSCFFLFLSFGVPAVIASILRSFAGRFTFFLVAGTGLRNHFFCFFLRILAGIYHLDITIHVDGSFNRTLLSRIIIGGIAEITILVELF